MVKTNKLINSLTKKHTHIHVRLMWSFCKQKKDKHPKKTKSMEECVKAQEEKIAYITNKERKEVDVAPSVGDG